MSVDLKELEEIAAEAEATNGVSAEPSAVSEAVDAATSTTDTEAAAPEAPSAPKRRYLTLEEREGYGLPIAGDVVYVHSSVEGFELPDFVTALTGLVAKKYEGKFVVTAQTAKTKDGQALGRRIFIDTPESKAAAEKTGRAPKVTTPKKVRTNADCKDILGKMMELILMDADQKASAGWTKEQDVRTWARIEACKALNFDLDTLVERAEELGIKTQLGL